MGDWELIQYIAKIKLHPTKYDELVALYEHALGYAIAANQIETIEILLQESNKAGFSLLGMACVKGDVDVIKYLLEKSGACHDLSDHKFNQKSIFYIIEERRQAKEPNAEEISEIYERYKNNTGAAARGNNLNSEKTAQFRRALANNDEKQLAKLLDEGVAPHWIMPDTGDTFLHWAIATKKSATIINLLLSKQPNLRVINLKGETPIRLAANMRDWATVLALGKHKQHGCDYSDINGEALTEAVKANAENTVKELAEAGASTKNSCLFEAIIQRNRNMVLLLLTYNADLQFHDLRTSNHSCNPYYDGCRI